MKHKIKIGKPVTKGDKIVKYDDVREIASNEVFNWNRRGYKAIPEDYVAPKKARAPASDNPDDEEDLNKLTVKQLREIAEPLGVKAGKKADLISEIEEARRAAG